MIRIIRHYLVKSNNGIVFLFPTNRRKILEEVTGGGSPDNELYGLNYSESLGWDISFVDVSLFWQNFLDKIFFLPAKLFRRQIDITFQLGRALLMLPAMNRADVIVTNTDSIGLPVCFLKRLGLVRPPVVYAVGLFYIQGKLKQAIDNGEITLFLKFYKWILSAADHIIYHSPIEKEKLVKLGLYNPAYCTFVAMGSDARFFQKRANSEFRIKNSELILAVGRDHARDYRTLFEAAGKLPDVNFIVICSRRNVEGLEIPQNVKVFFDLPYREVVDWYRKAVAVVIPMKEMHRSSGQMTLTDAIQAGKAIISSDVVGISHYGLKNGVDALLVPARDADKLSPAISRVATDKDLRRRLEKHTAKLAKIFTTENYARHISEAVDWIIDPIRLRPIKREDLEFIRRLRNENRQYFLDSNYISRQAQQKWFESYQNKSDDYMFILEDRNTPVGIGAIYHIEQAKKIAEIGRFIIDNSFRGRGYGKILLVRIERMAKLELDLTELRLEVFSDNVGAINLYRSQNFNKIKEKEIGGKRVTLMVKSIRGKRK